MKTYVYYLAILSLYACGCDSIWPPYVVNGYDHPCRMRMYFRDSPGKFNKSEFDIDSGMWIGKRYPDKSITYKIEVFDSNLQLIQTLDFPFLELGFCPDSDHESAFALFLSEDGATYLSKQDFRSRGFQRYDTPQRSMIWLGEEGKNEQKATGD